jgi:hypothetical protein
MKNIIEITKSVEIDTEVDVRLDLLDYKQELIANNPANSTKRTLEKDDCSLLVLAMNKV